MLRLAYSTWIEQYLANLGPNDRGFNDDPDGDGLTNIQEYLFGGDPTSDSHSVLPRMINSNGNLLYQVIINPETEGWRVIVETTEDFDDWDALGISEDGSEFTGDGILEVVEEDPLTTTIGPVDNSAKKRFYRTRAEQK